MFILQVSIGRNIGSEPMSDNDWTTFINRVSDSIRREGETPEFHFGQGVWEGIREESVRITVYREFDTDTNMVYIRARLASLAAYFGQDAIGMTFAESELILPSKD